MPRTSPQSSPALPRPPPPYLHSVLSPCTTPALPLQSIAPFFLAVPSVVGIWSFSVSHVHAFAFLPRVALTPLDKTGCKFGCSPQWADQSIHDVEQQRYPSRRYDYTVKQEHGWVYRSDDYKDVHLLIHLSFPFADSTIPFLNLVSYIINFTTCDILSY